MHHLASLLSKISLHVKISYHLTAEWTIQSHCFHNYTIYHTVPNYKYRHNACFTYIVFSYFSAVPNHFIYRQNACLGDIVFIFLSAVSNRSKRLSDMCFRYRDILFSSLSLQFRMVSKTIRMHTLETFFSLQFQIVSNTVRMHALETSFSIFSLT